MSTPAATSANPVVVPAAVLCPFCGTPQFGKDRCTACHKLFNEKNRKQAQAEMGPWYIRNKVDPFAAGHSYESMKRLARSGVLNAKSIVRGPSTQQFWLMAKFTPGISHLVGFCFGCASPVQETDVCCPKCKIPFKEFTERNELGLRFKTEEEAQQALYEAVAPSAGRRVAPANPLAPSTVFSGSPPVPQAAMTPRQAVLPPAKPGEKPFAPGADLLDMLFNAAPPAPAFPTGPFKPHAQQEEHAADDHAPGWDFNK